MSNIIYSVIDKLRMQPKSSSKFKASILNPIKKAKIQHLRLFLFNVRLLNKLKIQAKYSVRLRPRSLAR